MADPVVYYKDELRKPVGEETLPKISRDLDSVRAYQWEVYFSECPGTIPKDKADLTLAAKQISNTGFATTDIEVHRVNDKVFYPGKATPEVLTITFDNLIASPVSEGLWKWFKTVYNPLTGKLGGSTTKIHHLEVRTLNHSMSILGTNTYFGVYPQSYKLAEFNYSTNDFHTIEVTFRYDYMDVNHKDKDDGV